MVICSIVYILATGHMAQLEFAMLDPEESHHHHDENVTEVKNRTIAALYEHCH